MKDLGQLTYFLGLEVHFQHKGIFANQHRYIQHVIQLTGLTNFAPIDTPMEINLKL